MTTDDLARALRNTVATAPERRKATFIHLFGIEFSEALQGHNVKDVCALANLPVSYATEIYKGMRLAEFVELKQ